MPQQHQTAISGSHRRSARNLLPRRIFGPLALFAIACTLLAPRSPAASFAAAARPTCDPPVCHLQSGQVSPATGASAHQSRQQAAALSGTVVLNGRITSRVKLSMTGALSVGDATQLTWTLPLIPTLHVDGLEQQSGEPTFDFSLPPDTWSDGVDEFGNPVRRFVWAAPPSNTPIMLKERVTVTVTSALAPFASSGPFPLAPTAADLNPYLVQSDELILPPAADRTIASLTKNATTEQGVVGAVANWVAAITRYSRNIADRDLTASVVFRTHLANCRGYVNVMSGILRQLDIPTRVEYGWVSSKPLRLPGLHGASDSIQWSVPQSAGELHTWLGVWFPDRGWVAFDPQLEKGFVDPRHIAFLSRPDTVNTTVGSWTAQVVDGAQALGAPFDNGSTDIVPGVSDSSVVHLRARDSIQITRRTVVHDVNGVLLFGR